MKLKKLNSPFLISLILLFTGFISCKKESNIATQIKSNPHYQQHFLRAEKHFENQVYDSAFYYYNESKLACNEGTDTGKIIYSLLKMAVIQQIQGDYLSSETTATEAISLFQKTTNRYYKCAVYNILGINYERLYDYDNAILYYNKALNQIPDESQKTILTNNIAVAYIGKNDYKSALQLLLPLTLHTNISNDEENNARVLDNLGYCYFKMGDSRSLYYLNTALIIRKKIKDDFGITTSYLNIAEFYKKSNPGLSYKYAQLAYEKATKINNVDDRLKAIALLIRNSVGKETKKFSILHLHINDSINKARQKAKNQFAKIKYDSKKDKDENLELKTQKIENALLLEKQKNRNLILSFVIVFTLIISISAANFLMAKNRREKVKISYTTEIRISKKLHDELANDVYQTMAFAETQDLSSAQNKEVLLTSLDTIYSRTRNISRENSTIEAGALFETSLKEMMSGFQTNEINILTNGMDTIQWNAINSTKKITLYRVVQELLVNMKKHSQCSLVVLTFKKNKNKLQVDYTDNGIGATLEELTSTNGLQNVENRIHAIKGTLNFDSKSNKGFRVRFIFPI
ncbi:tetratricopeptide repeat protein [Flavobacterium sp. LB2P53]|uniref:tetratricopeptide repeat-containing sensor histidine kinase n=1 Tax=Flavobacterium sp. LB2P53 TaxID=2497481 RepID=UPI0013155F8D|nr:tetratricopeptide repeat protein [Flavobacterium sp. LB2P53]